LFDVALENDTPKTPAAAANYALHPIFDGFRQKTA
jgi:hypothetical protein